MPLHFSENVLAAKHLQRTIKRFVCRRQTNQPLSKLRQLFRRGRALAFFRAQFHARHEAAKVLIAGAIFHQQRILESVGASDLRADVRADAGFLCREMEARRAIDAIAIDQRQRRIAEVRSRLRQRLGQRRPLQETECRVRVQLYIRFSHSCPR